MAAQGSLPSISMADLVRVGECFWIAQHPELCDQHRYAQEIRQFFRDLEACDLKNTLAVAQTLARFSDPQRADMKPFGTDMQNHIRSCCSGIANALGNELGGRQVVKLQEQDATKRLHAFGESASLTEEQHLLLAETLRCFEASAYRSAMVMAWNFAYDFIRTWILADANRLGEFQAAADEKFKFKSPISEYSDFFASDKPLGEFEVLQCLRGASGQKNILNEKIIKNLEEHLRDRNNYAHPNFIRPSPNKAGSYIEELLDIIENPPISEKKQNG